MSKPRPINTVRSDLLSTRVWIILGLIISALVGIRTIAHSAFWIHLATGRTVLENGIPRTDSWSFALSDTTPWVTTTWLYDVILHLMWAGGPATVIGVHILLVTMALAIMSRLALPYATGPTIALGHMLASWLMFAVYDVGPHMFSLIFIGAYCGIMLLKIRTQVRWALLIVLQILWTNIHSSFLLGPLILLAFALPAIRMTTVPSDNLSPEENEPVSLFLALGLPLTCLLATLANPYGLLLHRSISSMLFDTTSRLEIQEWISLYSLQFDSSFSKNMNTIALVVGAGGLITHRGKLPLALTMIAMCGATTQLLSHIDFQIFALMAFPFFCLSLHSTGQFLCSLIKVPLANESRLRAHFHGGLAVLVMTISATMIISNQAYRMVGSDSHFGVGLSQDVIPAHIHDVLTHPDFPDKAYNLPSDGGYLAWVYPGHKIFMDQRPGLYPPDHYHTLVRALVGDAEAMATLQENWPADAIILNASWVRSGSAISKLVAQNQWGLAYFDGTTAVLLRNTPPYQDLLNDTVIQQQGIDVLAATTKRYRLAVSSLLGAPVNPRIVGAANVFYHLNQFEKAYAAYDLLLLNAPSMKSGWLHLGISQIQTKNPLPAMQSLKRALDANPENVLAMLWLSRAHSEVGNAEKAAKIYEQAETLHPEIAAAFVKSK